LDAISGLNKKAVHLELWLKQTSGAYGEMLIDDISATNQLSGTAPTITGAGLNTASGDGNTLFTLGATYTDADNQAPFRMQVVIDGVIHDMTGLDTMDTTYSDGKLYSYSTRLPAGTHSYYFRTTDTTTSVVTTPPVTGPTVAASSQPGQTIIVDNGDATGITRVGGWKISTARTDHYGADYWQDDNTGKGTKSVTFTPTIPAAGNYAVYMMWSAYPNRATNVPVDITSASGTTTVTVNEQQDGGTWNLLGTYAFGSGTSGDVRIRTDATNGYVIADAVKFVSVP
jgi:hypothetical protein